MTCRLLAVAEDYAEPVESTGTQAPLTHVFVFYGAVKAVPLIVLAVVLAVLLGIATGFSLVAALGLFILLALGIAAFLTHRRFSQVDEVLLDELDVVDADEDDQAREYNLLESLSLRSGVNAPELYLTDDEAVNGLAIQQSGDAAAVITRGAADKLDRLQLEGLLAEIIARIANDDARRATVAIGMLMPFTNGSLSFLAGPANKVIDRVLHADRELSGDIDAVGLTRYPPGLRDALSQADDQAVLGTPATARLWIVPPASQSPRYDLDVRLAALNEF